MKKIIIRYGIFALLLCMFISLLPGIGLRLSSERQNRKVTISVLYNDLRNKLSDEKLPEMLAAYKAEGIRTVSVMEEDINAMVARGDVTSIKYNVLRHKYDAESMEMADFIAERCPRIGYDSHVVIAARDEAKALLRYGLPRKYDDTEYADIGTFQNFDIYVLYDGRKELWDYPIGYNESVIEALSKEGFDVALIYKVKNYKKTDYLEDVARIVDTYSVSCLNIKTDGIKPRADEVIPENYEKIAALIESRGMTLVVTENTNQLSNQECLGYADIFAAAERGGRVMRAYETYDESQADNTNYKYRVAQFVNSTIDRNIRFITLTQIVPGKVPYTETAENTLRAAVEYKEKIEALGYDTDGEVQPFSYTARPRRNGAAAAAIMVLALALMIEMAAGKMLPRVRIAGIIGAVLAFLGTCILPGALLSLYPTAFCVIMSTFAVTVLLWFVRKKKDTLSMPLLLLGACACVLGALFLGAIVMGTLLSGLSYYVNNAIFRGIKLSLLIPVFYTAVLYYFMFIKTEKTSLTDDIKKLLFLDIKVYWVLIGAVIFGVGAYYIIRSGNVNSISGAEKALREGVSAIFPARPRTKEFLIGYPALVLFVYYMKNTNCHLVRWVLSVAAAIVCASVTNSFCHVFTDFSVILARTGNGILVGAVVSVFAYVANLVLLKILAFYTKKWR